MSGERQRHLALTRARLEQSADLKRATIEQCADAVAAAGGILVDALRGGAKVLAFGNGGSAADAQHFAAELAGRYVRERPALPALALVSNASDVTAIGNDYGFDRVFARLVEAHGVRGDVAVAISTSGRSANVNAAVEVARERGLRTLALTGQGGGALAALAETSICVPSDETPRIQEVHITLCHVLCEIVDAELFPESP
jgi:D-sedoheptulose 7-phosphate isomerase